VNAIDLRNLNQSYDTKRFDMGARLYDKWALWASLAHQDIQADADKFRIKTKVKDLNVEGNLGLLGNEVSSWSV
jgi:hypothetical protein